jgi:hypothetical protein
MATDERPIDPTCSCMVSVQCLKEQFGKYFPLVFYNMLVILPGVKKVYTCLLTLSGHKRPYGLSALVISQSIVYDEGTVLNHFSQGCLCFNSKQSLDYLHPNFS